MRPIATMALWLPCCAAPLIGCAAPPAPPPVVVPRIELVRPRIPDALLSCRPRPVPPAAGTQRDVAVYVIELDAAGASCRAALARVKAWQDAP